MKTSLTVFALALFLFSCNTSENNEPPIPMANLTIEIKLDGTKKTITDEATGEVIVDIDYDMSKVASLIYVVHDATTGNFGKALNLPQEMIKQYVKNGVATINDLLPFGIYYITMISTTEYHMENVLLSDGLVKNYAQAICQLPNEHIYYATYRVDCMPPYGQLPPTVTENIDFNLSAELERITGEYVLTSVEMEKIPANANFSMTFDVKDVPSAIFIASGKTPTNAEATASKIKKFSKKTTTENIKPSQLKSVRGKVYRLANDYLPPSERGSIEFIYKENKASSTITRQYNEALPETNSTHGSHITNIGLYTE